MRVVRRVLCSCMGVVVLVGMAVPAGASVSPDVEALELWASQRLDRALASERADSAVHAPLRSEGWREAIDATWGPGLPTARKLELFDSYWRTVDESFAAFQDLEVDWRALRDRYRPEIAAGVSRGRFAAIMNHLSLSLRESHSQALDLTVNVSTAKAPGVPLLGTDGSFSNTFGACATAQQDGSALVYAVVPGHPLGVEPGDRILGFEGRPWTELYPELLEAELPLTNMYWGSSPSSFDHVFTSSPGINWHLFETIDIAKHGTGEVEHLPTAPLQRAPRIPICAEQLDIPGVRKPRLFEDNVVTWGVVEGTNIGYIYVWGWFADAGPGFAQAVRELTQERETDGLIVDFRFNLGGNMFLSEDGLGMLFDRPTATIGFDERADPADHFKMRPSATPSGYVIDMFDGKFDPRSYDRPIAVLTGPHAVSSGDQVALRMTFHPHARTFGKSTATAFNAPRRPTLDPGWYFAYAHADAFRVGDPQEYLTHDEFPVDQPVWLTPGDVAAGKDTVVDAAIRWIDDQAAATPDTGEGTDQVVDDSWMSSTEEGPPVTQLPLTARTHRLWAHFTFERAPDSPPRVAWYVNGALVGRSRRPPSTQIVSTLFRNDRPLDQGIYKAVLVSASGATLASASVRLGPDSGVDRAWLSTTRNGAPVWQTVPRPFELWAHYVFREPPPAGTPLSVTFTGPRATVQRTTYPVRRRIDSRFRLPCSNCRLRTGHWRVTLRQGRRHVLTIHFQVVARS